MLVVVSVSQAPLPGLMMAPLPVLPASQVRFAAEDLAAEKASAASKRNNGVKDASTICNIRFGDMPRPALCWFIFIDILCCGFSQVYSYGFQMCGGNV